MSSSHQESLGSVPFPVPSDTLERTTCDFLLVKNDWLLLFVTGDQKQGLATELYPALYFRELFLCCFLNLTVLIALTLLQ